MIKLDNFEVLGWEHAIRGMRNPLNSWEQSDSEFFNNDEGHICDINTRDPGDISLIELGPNDLDLMTRLRKAGTDHRKFMRMLTVYVDITAPLYWWKEFDTYKVGTVANSCSTMHKIHAKEFTLDDFSIDIPTDDDDDFMSADEVGAVAESMVCFCESLRRSYNHYTEKAKDLTYTESKRKHFARAAKKYWRLLIQYMSISYNQKRTVMLNYEVLANIYESRRHHKLDEWHVLCDWIEKLPYSELITGEKE